MENNRSSWGSNLGFLLAAIGSAVGLGNIWGFPYKMGKSGGFTFLIVYLLLAVFVGMIIMVSELSLGRKTGTNPIEAYKKASKKFAWIGWLAVLAPFLIMSFYSVLGGYCIQYMSLNLAELSFGLSGIFGGAITGSATFGAMLTNPFGCIVFTMLFMIICMLIVQGGVESGIEKFNKVGMPALFVMLIVVIIRALTLPQAAEGLKFMFVPGYAVAGGFIEEAPSFISVLGTAGGQMFFSLSLAMGAMITYGSYLQKKENLQKNAILIIVMDTLVALMAGLCVIPGRFALDPDGTLGGPKLLFITMQNVFSRMGGLGPIFGILFYLLVVFAAVSSSISLLEVIVAHFVDKARDAGKGDKRKTYTLIAAACVGLGCILVCADALGSTGFAPGNLLGMTGELPTWAADWLDFWDMLSEGIMMPLGALLMSLMIGWEVGPEMVKEECEQSGHAMGSYGFFKICVKFITPLCMILILYGQIKEFFF